LSQASSEKALVISEDDTHWEIYWWARMDWSARQGHLPRIQRTIQPDGPTRSGAPNAQTSRHAAGATVSSDPEDFPV